MSKEVESIKLHVPGESFWATKLTDNTAQVDNILFDGSIGYGDIVKYDPSNNEVLSVLIKKTNTSAIKYSTDGDIRIIFKTISTYFEEKGIGVEGMIPGVAFLAVPIDFLEKDVLLIVNKCPVKSELILNEEQEQ